MNFPMTNDDCFQFLSPPAQILREIPQNTQTRSKQLSFHKAGSSLSTHQIKANLASSRKTRPETINEIFS